MLLQKGFQTIVMLEQYLHASPRVRALLRDKWQHKSLEREATQLLSISNKRTEQNKRGFITKTLLKLFNKEKNTSRGANIYKSIIEAARLLGT